MLHTTFRIFRTNCDPATLVLDCRSFATLFTAALGTGSVAIDAIPGDACEVDADHRGEPRPEMGGTMCDVGSVEVQASN